MNFHAGTKNEVKIKKLVQQLKILGVNVKHVDHELICTVNKVAVNQNTGEIIEKLVTTTH